MQGKRSSIALHNLAFGNIVVHSENGKFVVTITAARSARPAVRHAIQFALVLGFDQFVHQLRRGGEAHSSSLPAGSHAQAHRQVRLARACFAQKTPSYTQH
jgi:hypothetical protein